jgi:hypothetical protein
VPEQRGFAHLARSGDEQDGETPAGFEDGPFDCSGDVHVDFISVKMHFQCTLTENKLSVNRHGGASAVALSFSIVFAA